MKLVWHDAAKAFVDTVEQTLSDDAEQLVAWQPDRGRRVKDRSRQGGRSAW